MSAEGTERSSSPAPILLWGGVGTAPVGGLLLVAGGEGFLLRVGAFFIMVAVILVAVGALLARGRNGARGGMEGYVEEEIEALRDDLRADIAHAAKATHRSLAERVSALTDTVEALRGQIEVLRAHVERSHLNAPQPPPPAPAPVQASAGVVHHTETVHVTRQTYVDDGGTVYGAAKPVAVPGPRREPDPYPDEPELVRRTAPVGRTEQRMGERRASARADEHGSELHVSERRAEVRVDPTAAEMHVEDRWASSVQHRGPAGEAPTGRRRRDDDDEPSGRWAAGPGQAPPVAPGAPPRRADGEWAGAAPGRGEWTGPGGRRPEGEWAGAAPVSGAARRPEGEWTGAAPVSGAARRPDGEWAGAAPVSGAGRRPEGEWAGAAPAPGRRDGEWTGGSGRRPEGEWSGAAPVSGAGRPPQSEWAAAAPVSGVGRREGERPRGWDDPERSGDIRRGVDPERPTGRRAAPEQWAYDGSFDAERTSGRRARGPEPTRGGFEDERTGGVNPERTGRARVVPPAEPPAGRAALPAHPSGEPVPEWATERAPDERARAAVEQPRRSATEYGRPGAEYGARPAGSARPPGEYGRPPAAAEYGRPPEPDDDYEPRGRRSAE